MVSKINYNGKLCIVVAQKVQVGRVRVTGEVGEFSSLLNFELPVHFTPLAPGVDYD